MFGNDEYKGDFFYGRCYGKRFMLGNEIENPFLIREPRIKSILGRDTVEINDKYQKTLSAELNARLMVLSNIYPTINYSSAAERSRLLVVKMVKGYENTVGDSNFRPKLTA
jgi:phage/plasmid-associated DNA primase